jgi:uncharacterized protein (TIGR01777 family)
MRIGITGASGFIGKRIAALAMERGHEVVAFSRRPGPGGRLFSLEAPPDLSGLDAVIHLAGESILGLWTAEKKRRIIESRGEGTRRVVEALAAAKDGPKVLVGASAIGFYGDTGEELVDEHSPAGTGFLAETCRQWEAETLRAEETGARVVRVRIGFVLGREGAMKLVGPIFRLGGGGNLGSGRQWMSGVHVEDVAGIFLWAVENGAVSGPVNAVMPEPFRNAAFTREVARTLHRPAFLPAPAFAIRLALGELSHVMLDSCRVAPLRALEGGYVFRFASLPAALQDVLQG